MCLYHSHFRFHLLCMKLYWQEKPLTSMSLGRLISNTSKSDTSNHYFLRENTFGHISPEFIFTNTYWFCHISWAYLSQEGVGYDNTEAFYWMKAAANNKYNYIGFLHCFDDWVSSMKSGLYWTMVWCLIGRYAIFLSIDKPIGHVTLVYIVGACFLTHCNDIIMGAVASQITSLTIVYSFIQAQIKENIKAPRHWPLWGEFTGDRWIPRTKGQ